MRCCRVDETEKKGCSPMKLRNGFVDDLNGWETALTEIVAVPSYKKFFEITSSYKAIVVPNNTKLSQFNSRNQCHINCELAAKEGLGRQVSGWYVYCEYIFDDFPVGMCKLVHHSNLLLEDGTYVNPTIDDHTHHIFIRDDKRTYDLMNETGYNDRMVFGDRFMVGKDFIRSVPRNKILFSSGEHYDRDRYYEKFRVYKSPAEALGEVPTGLVGEERAKWLALKTNAFLS